MKIHKILFIFLGALFSQPLYAHHSKDHMMLSQSSEDIIAATKQGSQANELWILWTVVFIFIFLGIIRFWKARK